MLGQIEIRKPDGETMHLRTGRLRTLLGVLVADCMIEKHLMQREFWEIVAGSDGDTERARKGTNLAVHRLREAIGHDTIITGEETARLNLAMVQVDLLEAHGHLREAEEALRGNLLIRTYPALVKTLETVRSEVPFPGLYEDFFEAARQEFEYRLRSAIIEASRRLLYEGEAELAEKILRHGFDALPGDEEVAELLRTSLVEQGKHVEAERVKMRSEEIAMEG